jgi:hypothetical protein
LIEPSAERATVEAMASESRPMVWLTRHISFQKLILVAL